MYCPKCGARNDDNNFKCSKCGVVIQAAPVTSVPAKKKSAMVVVLVVAGIAVGLVIVMGILAAIAIPAYIGYQAKAGNAVAKADVKNACSSAIAIFAEEPDKTVTADDLKRKGVSVSPGVDLSIIDGSSDNLTIGAKHNKGTKIYLADKNCNIRETQP